MTGQSNPVAASSGEVKLRRATVMRFYCPACPATPGDPCVVEGTGEVRSALHRARVQKAERLIGSKLRAEGKLSAPSR